MYQSIGYTTAFSDKNNTLFKIEILGDTISSSEQFNITDPLPVEYQNLVPEKPIVPEYATYLTNKFKLLEVYDYNGNIITDKNNIDYKMCKEKVIVDIGICPYYNSMERGLQELRQKLFFNEIEMHINKSNNDEDNYEDNDEDNYKNNYEDFITIYEKKCNKQINFTGIQKIYDSDGNITHEFYHNNGIKEGNFFVYNYFTNYVINFVNDTQIGEVLIFNQHIP
jgi:hypothetical protein